MSTRSTIGFDNPYRFNASSSNASNIRLPNALLITAPASECAVHPTPATVPLTPTSSTGKTSVNTGPSHEFLIAQLVAAAGLVIVEALQERADGGLSPATKTRGGDLLARLVGLRQFLIADFPDFDALARQHGGAALRAADVSPIVADRLVDEVLTLLHKIVRTTLN